MYIWGGVGVVGGNQAGINCGTMLRVVNSALSTDLLCLYVEIKRVCVWYDVVDFVKSCDITCKLVSIGAIRFSQYLVHGGIVGGKIVGFCWL